MIGSVSDVDELRTTFDVEEIDSYLRLRLPPSPTDHLTPCPSGTAVGEAARRRSGSILTDGATERYQLDDGLVVTLSGLGGSGSGFASTAVVPSSDGPAAPDLSIIDRLSARRWLTRCCAGGPACRFMSGSAHGTNIDDLDGLRPTNAPMVVSR